MPKRNLAKNVKLGKGVYLGENVQIHANTRIGINTFIGNNAIIGHPNHRVFKAFLEANALEKEADINDFIEDKTVIGRNCIIRSGTVIYSGVTIGDNLDCAHNVIIREHSTIGNNVYIHPATCVHAHVKIGNNVVLLGTLGNRSIVDDNVSMLGFLAHKYKDGTRGRIEKAPRIRKGAIVGVDAVVVGGITVGENAVIGANATVTKNVEPSTVVISLREKRLENKMKNLSGT